MCARLRVLRMKDSPGIGFPAISRRYQRACERNGVNRSGELEIYSTDKLRHPANATGDKLPTSGRLLANGFRCTASHLGAQSQGAPNARAPPRWTQKETNVEPAPKAGDDDKLALLRARGAVVAAAVAAIAARILGRVRIRAVLGIAAQTARSASTSARRSLRTVGRRRP